MQKKIIVALLVVMCSLFVAPSVCADTPTQEPQLSTGAPVDPSITAPAITPTVTPTIVPTASPTPQNTENLTDAVVSITLTGVENATEISFTIANEKLTFSKDNNWSCKIILKIGKHDITNIGANTDDIAVSLDQTSITVTHLDGETVVLSVTESKVEQKSFWLELLKDNAFFLIGIAICGIGLFVVRKRSDYTSK